MPLPSPNLDDRDFAQLVDEALSVVRRTCPDWTDLSPSDPGVVLLEAFAHLTETMLYRLNRLPEKAHVALLNLIGVTPCPPCAAGVVLTFSVQTPTEAAIKLPAGTRVTSPRGADGTEGPVFETLASAVLSAGEQSVEVPAAHCSNERGELCGIGNGMPGQLVRLAHAPLVASNLTGLELLVGIELDDNQVQTNAYTLDCDGRVFRVWREVEAFHDLGEDRCVYLADRYNGIVTFAPSVRTLSTEGGHLDAEPSLLAEVPPLGRQIRVWYRHGGGAAGNVRPGLLTVMTQPLQGVTVTNAQAAVGGSQPESLENAIARGPMSLHALERAVTARDFELLAVRSSAGVNRAWACADAAIRAHGVPGTVSVTVIPQIQDAGYPVTAQMLETASPAAILRQVQAGLDLRRPLGTACIVRWARYKSVRVKADVLVFPGEDAEAVRTRIIDSLNRLIDPIARGPSRPGWPFGKPITSWDVMRRIGGQAGIATVRNLRLAIDKAPNRGVATLTRDAFQSDTWYTASGAIVFRSGNNGESWEALRDFGGDSVVLVDACPREPGDESVRAGLLCVVTRSAEGASSLYLSRDGGDSFVLVSRLQLEIPRCAPWRAKRRRVVPGRRGRERVAAVAKGRESRSRGGNMQSASHTPSSHLRALSCPADQRGVGHGCDRRANPGTKGRRHGPSPRGSRMPPRGITRDTRLSGESPGSSAIVALPSFWQPRPDSTNRPWSRTAPRCRSCSTRRSPRSAQTRWWFRGTSTVKRWWRWPAVATRVSSSPSAEAAPGPSPRLDCVASWCGCSFCSRRPRKPTSGLASLRRDMPPETAASDCA
jgi:hypothetical protein